MTYLVNRGWLNLSRESPGLGGQSPDGSDLALLALGVAAAGGLAGVTGSSSFSWNQPMTPIDEEGR